MRMHGTKNNFHIVDYPVENLETHAVELCEDGSDGVLYVFPSNKGLAKMRIFNQDGTEPEMCGNGLRCFARYIFEKNKVYSGKIETLKELYDVKYVEDFFGIVGIEIKLSPVYMLEHKSLQEYNDKFDQSFEHFTVSNPHIVDYWDQYMAHNTLISLGSNANKHFDEGMNVNIIHLIDRGRIYVQTFERGVGITKSCGTGMTASSVKYARDHDYFNQDIKVYNDGGMIICRVTKERNSYTVYFIGNATYYDKDAEAYEVFYNKTRKEIKDA